MEPQWLSILFALNIQTSGIHYTWCIQKVRMFNPKVRYSRPSLCHTCHQTIRKCSLIQRQYFQWFYAMYMFETPWPVWNPRTRVYPSNLEKSWPSYTYHLTINHGNTLMLEMPSKWALALATRSTKNLLTSTRSCRNLLPPEISDLSKENPRNPKSMLATIKT